MARLSKAQHFEVYEDSRPSNMTSPRSNTKPRPSLPRNDSKLEHDDHEDDTLLSDPNFQTVDEDSDDDDDDDQEEEDEEEEGDEDCDEAASTSSSSADPRRESNFTTISSMPSTLHPSAEFSPPYTPPQSQPQSRPTFRRAESVRRMQMTSPTPSLTHQQSPQTFSFPHQRRRSIIRSSPRPGTPRSARSYKSPRSRKALFIAEEEEEEEKHQQYSSLHGRIAAADPEESRDDNDVDDVDKKDDYPLVLLHLTLLPVDLPWSTETLSEVLPARTQEHLQVLRAQISETVLQRGILIPHPREDYGLLEERLLEALELKAEKITKCGHYIPSSADAAVVVVPSPAIEPKGHVQTFHNRGESLSSFDSGHGRSLPSEPDADVDAESENEETKVMGGEEGEREAEGGICGTCAKRVETSKSGIVGSGGQRWTVKVFAANGLMRAPAWAAAWPEMERVDVEILPWIGDEVRKGLDAREKVREEEEKEEEEEEEKRRGEDRRRREGEEGEGEGRRRRRMELTWRGEDREHGEREMEMEMEREREREFAADVLARMVSVSGQFHRSGGGRGASLGSVVHHHHPQHQQQQQQHHEEAAKLPAPGDLPPIYRPSEIPLSLLLRNYIFLLAQDTRNVAIVALTIIALWLSVQSAYASASSTPPPGMLAPALEVCPNVEALPLAKDVLDASVRMVAPPVVAANASQVVEVVVPGEAQMQRAEDLAGDIDGIVDSE